MDNISKNGFDEANSPFFLPNAQVKAGLRMMQQLEALTTANVDITRELNLEMVLQRIADTARDFGGANYSALGIVNSAGVITSFITSGISQTEREQIGAPPRGHGLLGILIEQGQPLRVPDMSRDPRRSGFPPHHPPMTSLLGVPVSLEGRVVGNLYLTDKTGSVEFTADDERWIILFAQQAAIAVENANLYKKMSEAHQRAQTLAELTSALNRAIEPGELFQQITRAACHLLELPAAALYLLNNRRTFFELEAQTGLRQSETGKDALSLEDSIAGQVLVSQRSLSVPDTSRLSKILFLPMTNGKRPQALLVVPIRLNAQHIVGVIEVYSVEPREFSQEEIALLEAFADQAALSLERVRIYQQKEDFLSMTAHDLRAPLTAIKMSSGLLQSSLPDNLPQPLLQLVANISRNSERLNAMLEDLLDLTRLEQGRIHFKLSKVELGSIVRATAQTLLPMFEGKGQTLSLEFTAPTIPVTLDRHRFEQILVNLLTNAHKYTPAGGQVLISFTRLSECFRLYITDNGPGIPENEQELIFNRYYRRAPHEQSTETTGSGLGLPIARRLAELQNGKLWVESTAGRGSTFCLELPLEAISEAF